MWETAFSNTEIAYRALHDVSPDWISLFIQETKWSTKWPYKVRLSMHFASTLLIIDYDYSRYL